MVLEKTLESLLDCKEIQLVHPKGDQSWVFTGRTDLKLKLQYFGHLMQRVDSFEKTQTSKSKGISGKEIRLLFVNIFMALTIATILLDDAF